MTPILMLAAATILVGLAGCQTYQPEPLDAAAHAARWVARSVDSNEVTDFALRLADAGARFAATYDPTDGLTMDEGVVVALFFNPDLRVARLEAGVEQVTAANAGRWSDPMLSADALRVLESTNTPWLFASGLAVTIPISGRLGAEADLHGARATVAHHDVHVAEWRLITDFRERWVAWAVTVERIELLEDYLGRLASFDDAAQALAGEGELNRVAAQVVKLERLARQSDLHHLRSKAQRLSLGLKRTMGLRPDAPVELESGLPGCPAVPPLEALATRLLDANPILGRSVARYRAAERALALEIRKQYPDLELGPVAEYEEREPRLGLGVSFPLPLWNANRGGIARARAARRVARAAFEADREGQVFALHTAWHRAKRAHAHWTFQRREMLPVVEAQLENLDRLSALRAVGVQWVIDGLRVAHETKMSILETRLEEILAHQALDAVLCRAHTDCRREVE